MMERSESRGWRDSVWNQSREKRQMARNALALGATNRLRSGLPPQGIGTGAGSVLSFYAAPWIRPVRHRYETGNRWLMRALEWVTAKTWPLAVLDDMCMWFEQGSLASRMFVASVAAAVMTLLLSMHSAALYGLQAITLLPVFGGKGTLVLVAASFVTGATLLPMVLGHVIGVLLRFYVLLNLCTMAALVGYGSWLLYSYAKF